jgi:hypothetical protein
MRKLAKIIVIAALACFGLALLAGASRGATVQNQNSSDDGFARSGDSTATNSADLRVGPSASSIADNAQASQIGSNSVSVSQASVARTGDAVVNSQITGIVGGGNSTVQNQNSSSGGTATSGDALSGNTLDVAVGPDADSIAGDALASQLGDNEVVISQSAEAVTGDAVLGSQVTGIVGGWDSTVQGQNSFDGFGAFATSGVSDAFNSATGNAGGPEATSPAGSALASQNGDNASDLAQDALAESGDGVVGSQVSGVVGDSVGFTATREFGASL